MRENVRVAFRAENTSAMRLRRWAQETVKYLTKDEMGKTSDLTPTELGQLVEYLQELDDVPETPAAPPSRPHAAGGIGCAVAASFHGASGASDAAWLFLGLAAVARKRRPNENKNSIHPR